MGAVKILAVLGVALPLMASSNLDRVLLVINYNHAYYQSVPFLRKIYSPTFKNIVFYGPESHPDVNLCRHQYGYYSYHAVALAMQKYPGFDGYLFLHDDCILNTKLLDAVADTSRIWSPEIQWGAGTRGCPIDVRQESYGHWGWWNTDYGRDAMRKAFWKLPAQHKKTLSDNWGQFCVCYGYADIAYIPAKYRTSYIELSEIFEKQHAFLELALPTIVSCLAPKQEWVFLPGYNGDASRPELKRDLIFSHPLKLSSASNRALVEEFFSCAQ